MRVLVPDLPAFHALAQPGDTFLPGAELAFYSNDKGVPDGEAQGVVLWLANGATRDALLSVPGLQWVLTLTAGIEHVQGKLPQGAALYNAHRLHDRAVAVHVVAGMLAASRGLHRFRDAQQRGEWVRTSLADTGLSTLDGQKVVLWGYGHIGKIVEELLAPFGAQVYGLTSKTEPDLVDYRLAAEHRAHTRHRERRAADGPQTRRLALQPGARRPHRDGRPAGGARFGAPWRRSP